MESDCASIASLVQSFTDTVLPRDNAGVDQSTLSDKMVEPPTERTEHALTEQSNNALNASFVRALLGAPQVSWPRSALPSTAAKAGG